jgi:hypothetical protein
MGSNPFRDASLFNDLSKTPGGFFDDPKIKGTRKSEAKLQLEKICCRAGGKAGKGLDGLGALVRTPPGMLKAPARTFDPEKSDGAGARWNWPRLRGLPLFSRGHYVRAIAL